MRFSPNQLSAGFLLVALALTGLSTPASAQQVFAFTPSVQPFATRGTVDGNSGETLQGFHAATHRGLGDVSGRCEIRGFWAMLRDGNAATVETYDIVVRHGDDATGPSRSPSKLAGKIVGLKTPGGSGSQKWSVTTTFSTPIRLFDCKTHFAAGIAFPASPSFPTDALQSFADTDKAQSSHSRQEAHAWDFIGASTVPSRPSNKRSYRYGLLLPNAIMQMGNGGSHYSMGGMFPKTGTPLTARVRGGSAMNNAVGLVVLSSKQFRLEGVPLGFGARIYLSPSYHFNRFTTDANGEATLTLSTAMPLAFAGLGTFHFQSVVDKNGALFFTNCQTVIP